LYSEAVVGLCELSLLCAEVNYHHLLKPQLGILSVEGFADDRDNTTLLR
jgi:hypothetical protein